MGKEAVQQAHDAGPSLKPARPEDSEFVFQVKKAALGEYIEKTWGWDEQFQRDFHVSEYQPTTIEIICWQNTDVGWLAVERGSDGIRLTGIYMLPEYQSRGVGSTVIRQIIKEATATQLPVTLEVLKVNPRARALYEKLGFVVTGETETHNLMELSR
ncbi:MAG: GNAT family N-acetyltransferase [Gemmatimonadales bacterium]|jgi:ribosomal protein S18 acetylase RimI-like enzyme